MDEGTTTLDRGTAGGAVGALASRHRRLWQGLLVAILALSMVGVAAVPASAQTNAWVLNDGFEANPTNWVTQTNFNGSARVLTNSTYARSGSRLAILQAPNNSWAAVRRTVEIVPAASRQATCGFSVWVRSYGHTVPIQLEVIEDGTWREIVRQSHWVAPSANYQQISVGTWTSHPLQNRRVIIRIGMSNPNPTGFFDIDVDDVRVTCYY